MTVVSSPREAFNFCTCLTGTSHALQCFLHEQNQQQEGKQDEETADRRMLQKLQKCFHNQGPLQ